MNRFASLRWPRAATRKHSRARPALEPLEDRTVLNSYMAASPEQLIAAIVDSNQHHVPNTITLAPGRTFTLSQAQNSADGGNGLPMIGKGNRLTIVGNGDRIQRSTAAATAFRLFDVAAGATLTLKDVTLSNGLATGTTMMGLETDAPDGEVFVLAGSETLGGGILNEGGTLNLLNVTMDHNTADASALGGVNAGGGAIANILGGTVTVTNSRFQCNQAIAGTGDSYGGGIFDDASKLNIACTTFSANQATRATFIDSGGGAIANEAGSDATVTDCVFQDNAAIGGTGGYGDGHGAGGGIASQSWGLLDGAFVGSSLTVSRTAFVHNQAIGGDGTDALSDGVAGDGNKGLGSAIVSDGPDSSAFVSSCQFTDNLCRGGAGGDGGTANPDGGAGGVAFGTVDTASAALTVVDSQFVNNLVQGGDGGAGVGGYGGDGGAGLGGAIDSTELSFSEVAPSLVVRNVTFVNNQAHGGAGGAGATGGGGGSAQGGSINVSFGTMDVRNSTFLANQAIGGVGTNVGFYGLGVGGGIACGSPFADTAGIVAGCTFIGNLAQGGAGGAGSDGGLGLGGGLANGIGELHVTGTSFIANQASGGAGVNGGAAEGGGCYNIGTAYLTQCLITDNAAVGGLAGPGGEAGDALGGGVCNDGGSIWIDPLTFILGNKPKNRYGC